MKNENVKYKFLVLNGFNLMESLSSDSFDDNYYIFSNGEVLLKYSKIKSFQSIEIQSVLDTNNWIDLALIIALINNEEKLNIVRPINELEVFLEKHLDDILELFTFQNYVTTKVAIEILENKRVKQMFPNI